MKRVLILTGYLILMSGGGFAEALPDPTRPYQYGAEIAIEQIPHENVQWRLSGIRIRENKRSAILNGKLVKEGDKLDGAVVMEIKASEVTLQQRDKRLVVKLLLSNIKQPVSAGGKE